MVEIISEVGVNFNGNINLAYQLIDIAKDCGADIVKFQVYKTDNLVIKNSPQYNILKELELSEDNIKSLFKYSNNIGIEFLVSIFDLESLNFVSKLGLKRIKIPSGEINNLQLLNEVNKLRLPVVLSTGMSNNNEIEQALLCLSDCPVTLLHCVSLYPTSYEQANLKRLDWLAFKYGKKVGLSDHSMGIDIPIAAIARGAIMIEKHLTIDKNLPGPDHQASLEPNKFKEMVNSIRNIEKALDFTGLNLDYKTAKISRKSLVANCDIKVGEIFTEQNLAVKRPGTGIPANQYYRYLGSIALNNYSKDELIKE
jgi:N,N'-diacetyllegionaminate synthase